MGARKVRCALRFRAAFGLRDRVHRAGMDQGAAANGTGKVSAALGGEGGRRLRPSLYTDSSGVGRAGSRSSDRETRLVSASGGVRHKNAQRGKNRTEEQRPG